MSRSGITKCRVTITLDEKLMKKIRKKNINLSKTINTYLLTLFQND